MANAVTKSEASQTSAVVITPAEMISQALESKSNPETLGKLLDLQERWEANQARKTFDNAMADLRANLPEIIKTQDGHNYKYEDLSDIVRQVSPIMSKHGLSFRWRTNSTGGNVEVSCVITHRDGHSEVTSLEAQPDKSGSKNSIQAIGSAVTYLQRYTLKAALGIAASHDDDAQSVMPKNVADGPDPLALLVQAKHDLSKAETKADLKDVWEAIQWDFIPNDLQRDLVKEKDARIEVLNKPKAEVTADQSLDNQFPGDLPA